MLSGLCIVMLGLRFSFAGKHVFLVYPWVVFDCELGPLGYVGFDEGLMCGRGP